MPRLSPGKIRILIYTLLGNVKNMSEHELQFGIDAHVFAVAVVKMAGLDVG